MLVEAPGSPEGTGCLSYPCRVTRARWAAIAGSIVLILGIVGWAAVPSSASDDTAAIVFRVPAGSSTTEPATAVAPPVSAAPTSSTAAPRGPLGSGLPVTIGFGGDSHFEAGLRSRLAGEGGAMLEPLVPLFAGADLTILNLETAITERGSPQPKEYTFRTTPAAFDALAAVGVDAVSMANNHGLDFGPEGLEDSLAARDASPIPVIGIGRTDADAYRPFRATVNGQRVAVIAATQVLDSELITAWTATPFQAGLASAKRVEALTAAVAAARTEADTVVVFLHWGTERQECPNAAQTDLAPTLLAAGADIVVGSHAHRLLGAGRMGDGFVAYGLGNFIWFNESGPNGDTGALLVTATGRRIDDYQWRPAHIHNGVPTMLDGAAAVEASTRWDWLRACTGLTP